MPSSIFRRHPKPRKRPQPRPYAGPVVTTCRGLNHPVIMSAGMARRLLGAAKGGRKTQALGKAHKWTSETARAAARKLWDRVHPRKTYSGAQRRGHEGETWRPGLPSGRAPRQSRAAWRAFYAEHPTNGYEYHPEAKFWTYTTDQMCNLVSERTALRRLGHLPYPNKSFVPITVRPVVGLNRATQKDSKG